MNDREFDSHIKILDHLKNNYDARTAGSFAQVYTKGKVLVLDSALTQVCFDDYTFTKGEAEGTYIWALYGADGVPINGTKSELQQRFSAETDFAGKPGNTPLMFTALLNKKGVQDTAVMNLEYFVSRFASALAAAPPMPPSQ